ncbi:MAG: protein kinase [Lacipirellulaceae bacterium]
MAELKTFLFTDICGSVRLKNEMTGRSVTERDLAFIQTVLTPHRARIEAKLIEMGGRVVSTAGDGHFLVFDNTIQAAQWAVDVQESHRDQPIVLPSGEHVETRMSVHVGVPQVDPSDPDNFVGKSVDYAARLNDYATGGQILCSRSVMAILDDVGLDGIKLYLHGRRELKGIGMVEVHEVLYDEVGPRTMRNEPKSHSHRQWTVIPTMGFAEAETDPTGGIAVVGSAIKQVGNYVLEGQLGAGGMGDVYKARHKQFDRLRAVKVIKPQYVGPGHKDVINRFYNEIKAVGKLEHKNIVVAIDSSNPTDKVHYLVMEYLEGVGLDELVSKVGPLAVPDACEIIRQAAQGLEYIHRHEMVHRDIKPSNLMLTLVDGDKLHSDHSQPSNGDQELGVVKILDLGLALLADQGDDRLTRYDNKAMGTGMYMPPEQWKTTSVDIRADIYSLGCTLYHLLAGNPPFIDSDLRPEKAHEKQPLPPIRSANIPKKLWDVLKKMTAKRQADRYASPAEVAEALVPFLEGHDLAALRRQYDEQSGRIEALTPTHSDMPSRQDTLWSKIRSGTGSMYPTRRWMLGTAMPLLAMAGMLGGTIWMMQRNANRAAENARETAEKTLPSFAHTAVTTNLAPQIEARFDVLVLASEDERLRALLKDYNRDPEEFDVIRQLQEWLGAFSSEHTDLRPDSWFINSRDGTQVARKPTKDSIGKNYAYRDYFHGGGRNLSKKEVSSARPITRPNLSTVYEGSPDKKTGKPAKIKVAFSVPIFETPYDKSSEVLGVLSLSVEVGTLERLDLKSSGDNEVLLVDTRPDYLAGNAEEGLVLDHPEYQSTTDPKDMPRFDGEILASMKKAVKEERGMFITGYRDPLDEAEAKLHWGAFEPVYYDLEADGEKRSTGWVVLVQDVMVE